MLKNIKQAFTSFIAACNTLTEATRENTEAVVTMHRELLNLIKAIEQSAKYLVDAKKRELQRAGHNA